MNRKLKTDLTEAKKHVRAIAKATCDLFDLHLDFHKKLETATIMLRHMQNEADDLDHNKKTLSSGIAIENIEECLNALEVIETVFSKELTIKDLRSLQLENFSESQYEKDVEKAFNYYDEYFKLVEAHYHEKAHITLMKTYVNDVKQSFFRYFKQLKEMKNLLR